MVQGGTLSIAKAALYTLLKLFLLWPITPHLILSGLVEITAQRQYPKHLNHRTTFSLHLILLLILPILIHPDFKRSAALYSFCWMTAILNPLLSVSVRSIWFCPTKKYLGFSRLPTVPHLVLVGNASLLSLEWFLAPIYDSWIFQSVFLSPYY